MRDILTWIESADGYSLTLRGLAVALLVLAVVLNRINKKRDADAWKNRRRSSGSARIHPASAPIEPDETLLQRAELAKLIKRDIAPATMRDFEQLLAEANAQRDQALVARIEEQKMQKAADRHEFTEEERSRHIEAKIKAGKKP